ncbi:MAG: WG repeat-containing protein [Nitrososphaeria archaeon]
MLLFSMFFTSCTIFKNTQFEINKQELPELIPYRVGNKWGYCDRNKNIVIQPTYGEAHLFSEGLALISLDGKFGYIDNSGKTIIEPLYDSAGDFNDGFAIFIVRNIILSPSFNLKEKILKA